MVKRVTRRCKKRRSRKSQRGGVFGWGKSKVAPNTAANEAAKAAANEAAKAAANEAAKAAVQPIIDELQKLFPITIGTYGSIEWEGNEDRTLKIYRKKFENLADMPDQTHGLYLLLKVWGLDDISSSKEQPKEFNGTNFKLIKFESIYSDTIQLTYNGKLMASIEMPFKPEIYAYAY